jgi:hypothetical protein
MEKSTCGRHRRARGGGPAAGLGLTALLLTACATAGAEAAELSPAGTTWRESFYENFALQLSDEEAECVADDVGELTRMVGPLVGQRPDDTPTSIWSAVDDCLAPASKGELARAIVYGGWSSDVADLAGVWGTADDELSSCVESAGGWRAVGSYTALMATCASCGRRGGCP